MVHWKLGLIASILFFLVGIFIAVTTPEFDLFERFIAVLFGSVFLISLIAAELHHRSVWKNQIKKRE